MRAFEWIAAAILVAVAIYFAVSLWQGFNDPYGVSTFSGGMG